MTDNYTVQSQGISKGGARGAELLTGNIEYFTLYTSLNITASGDYRDNTQKDFDMIIQVIGMRAMPIIMNTPVRINGIGQSKIEAYGAPSITGKGWIFKFAFEREGVHSIDTLTSELNGIVLNGGTIDTKDVINMEFTKQDML
jgi:hypothetical protein